MSLVRRLFADCRHARLLLVLLISLANVAFSAGPVRAAVLAEIEPSVQALYETKALCADVAGAIAAPSRRGRQPDRPGRLVRRSGAAGPTGRRRHTPVGKRGPPPPARAPPKHVR